MKKLVISAAGLLALAIGPATAADMPVKAPVLKAPMAVWSWTGAYVGINGGYSWGNWDTASLASIFPLGTGLGTTYSPSGNGWLFGGQIGYNWQVDRSWLLGLEADFQWTGERASASGGPTTARFVEPGADFNDVFTTATNASWKFPWFATFRGRIGLLADPELLLYATGGLAVGKFEFATSTTITCARFGPGSAGTTPAAGACVPPAGAPLAGTVALGEDTTRLGYAVGAGLEKHFGPSWSAKLEYLYLDFGSQTFLSNTTTATTVRLRDHIARAGLNYSFSAAPVVARY